MLSGIKSLCLNSEVWKLVGPTKEVRGRRLLCSVSSTLWILPTTKYKWGCQFKSSPFWLGQLSLNQQTLFILVLNLSIHYQRQACILMSRVLWRLMLLLRRVYYQILRAYRLLSACQPRLPPVPARFHPRQRRPVPLYLLLFRIIRHN